MMDDATQIATSGAMNHAAELLKKLAGPAFEEAGAMLGDTLRVYRVKNLVRTSEKTQKILNDAGLPAQAVAARLLLPILDACSVEDDDDLQTRWAKLLASASVNGECFSRSFIATLEQLSPVEAHYWDKLLGELAKLSGQKLKAGSPIPYYALTHAWKAPQGVGETFERLGLITREYSVALENDVFRSMMPSEEMEPTIGEVAAAFEKLDAEVQFRYELTAYGVAFSKACSGPDAAD